MTHHISFMMGAQQNSIIYIVAVKPFKSQRSQARQDSVYHDLACDFWDTLILSPRLSAIPYS